MCVSELHWLTQCFPPCVRHDSDWNRDRRGVAASRTFCWLQCIWCPGVAGRVAGRCGRACVVRVGKLAGLAAPRQRASVGLSL